MKQSVQINTNMLFHTSMITNLGKLEGFPHFSMQNLRGPLLPLRAANPS